MHRQENSYNKFEEQFENSLKKWNSYQHALVFADKNNQSQKQTGIQNLCAL